MYKVRLSKIALNSTAMLPLCKRSTLCLFTQAISFQSSTKAFGGRKKINASPTHIGIRVTQTVSIDKQGITSKATLNIYG